MSRKILIVTEHGHNYTHEGELFITNAMKDRYGVAANTHFFSGPMCLRPGAIAKAIVPPNDDIFVVCATNATSETPGNLKIFPPETLDQLAKDLVDPKYDGKTAWEILKILSDEK